MSHEPSCLIYICTCKKKGALGFSRFGVHLIAASIVAFFLTGLIGWTP